MMPIDAAWYKVIARLCRPKIRGCCCLMYLVSACESSVELAVADPGFWKGEAGSRKSGRGYEG